MKGLIGKACVTAVPSFHILTYVPFSFSFVIYFFELLICQVKSTYNFSTLKCSQHGILSVILWNQNTPTIQWNPTFFGVDILFENSFIMSEHDERSSHSEIATKPMLTVFCYFLNIINEMIFYHFIATWIYLIKPCVYFICLLSCRLTACDFGSWTHLYVLHSYSK